MILLDALAARFGGTAHAVYQLARALINQPGVAQVFVVTRTGSIVAQGMESTGPATTVLLPAVERLELARRTLWQAQRLPKLVQKLGVSGVFSFSGILPRGLPVPLISLVANPVPYEDRFALGSVIRRWTIARTARRAVATYVPSEHVANLVSPMRGLKVVPLGVDRSVFRPAEGPGHELLYVADFYRHKHHDLVLRAYRGMAAPRPVLRLIGDPAVDPTWYSEILELAAAIPGVEVDGRVSFSELRAAYRRALAFVIASDRESFSMPVAEAVCCGLPIIIRDYPTLRETAGGAGFPVAGNDPALWTSALDRIVRDNALRDRLTRGALEQAERFSWDTMAAHIVTDLLAGWRKE